MKNLNEENASGDPLEEMRAIAAKIKSDNPALEIRYNADLVAYVNKGSIGMIVSRVIGSKKIVGLFDRPLLLNAMGKKPEDYALMEGGAK